MVYGVLVAALCALFDEVLSAANGVDILQSWPAARLQAILLRRPARLYNGEQDILHRITPGIPVTTNFMLAGSKDKHYDSWARDVDFVSNRPLRHERAG